MINHAAAPFCMRNRECETFSVNNVLEVNAK